MGKVGFSKKSAGGNKSIKIKNKEGGTVFTISNPAQNLIASASYMGEPGYYPDGAIASESDFNSGVLDENGTSILKSAISVAKGQNPEQLLCIAKWAREEMNMRLFPQILAVAAARFIRGDSKSPNPISMYLPAICSRPDDLLQVLALYNSLFGTWEEGYPRARLPGCLQKGMAYALMSYSDYQLIKYNRDGHPSFKDLLLAIRGGVLPKRYHRKEGFPLSKYMFEFLVNDKILDDSCDMLKARKQFFQNCETATLEELGPLAITAGLTWENFISAVGKRKGSEFEKQEVWSIAFKLMPYMAKLRNLRNAIEYSVDGLKEIIESIADENAVLKGKQLPFRYYTAYKAIKDLGVSLRGNKVLSTMEECLRISIKNLPSIPGNTAVFVDNSGSMSSPLSSNSSMSMAEAGNLLGAIFYETSDNSITLPFGSKVAKTTLSKGSIISNAQHLGSLSHIHDHGTDAGACIRFLIDNKITVDRIIILSDLQTYGDNLGYGNVNASLKSYRDILNKNVWLHSVNLAASQFSMVKANHPRVNLLGGFSEKIINFILQAEGDDTKTTQTKKLPVLEDIITRHTVTSVDGFLKKSNLTKTDE